MILGKIKLKEFLQNTNGIVRGRVVTDAKDRYYAAEYVWQEDPLFFDCIIISRADGTGNQMKIKSVIELDESLVAFFGLYSGDGAKGSEDVAVPGKIKPVIHDFRVNFFLLKLNDTHGRIFFIYGKK